MAEAYPAMTVKEEQTIETDEGKLFVDIYIKELGVAIECQGRQHYQMVKHFHGSKQGYAKSQARDAAKALALEEEGITFVEVPYTDESKVTAKYMIRLIQKAMKG